MCIPASRPVTTGAGIGCSALWWAKSSSKSYPAAVCSCISVLIISVIHFAPVCSHCGSHFVMCLLLCPGFCFRPEGDPRPIIHHLGATLCSEGNEFSLRTEFRVDVACLYFRQTQLPLKALSESGLFHCNDALQEQLCLLTVFVLYLRLCPWPSVCSLCNINVWRSDSDDTVALINIIVSSEHLDCQYLWTPLFENIFWSMKDSTVMFHFTLIFFWTDRCLFQRHRRFKP